MSELSVKVIRKDAVAEDICSFELAGVDGRLLSPFSAGSHIDVHLPNGIVRQYSLCNPPQERHRYLIAVLRDPNSRGGSVCMHQQVQVGDMLRISEPKNHFALVPARRALLFAGGIGVTPLLSMAERLAQTQAAFEMHYCARSASRMAFADRIRMSMFSDAVHFHFDDGPDAQKLDAERVLAQPSPQTHMYVCGPTGFMNWVIGAAQKLGWLESNIHREYFAAAPVDTSHDGSFQIKIASTGQLVTVPRGCSAVAALAVAGVEIPVSCEQGICGTCLTRVLEGQIDHRDMYLTEEERAKNDQFTPCVSRASSQVLVVDL